MGIVLIKISLLLLLFSFGEAADAPVDGLLAVVGKNTILHTDVFQQAQMIAMQQGLDITQNQYAFEAVSYTHLTLPTSDLV